MTNKVYKTAMGKTVDMGALMLQNEQVRAVGNMKVNARGDVVDSANRVIDRKTNQVNRQYRRQTSGPAPTNTVEVKKQQQAAAVAAAEEAKLKEQFPDLPQDDYDDQPVEATPKVADPAQGGMAGALARAKAAKQTK
jgi:hypothetical protein